MVRAPCCEKMGLKKGTWTMEEDRILINYINQHGHDNWRALPKRAGLLRCGKSCRLRWTNYLRPDIKRGNFSKEEEETIIKLHELLGNRWSYIAASLPGRTDNEIKNVWHTHLKKRLKQAIPEAKIQQIETPRFDNHHIDNHSSPLNSNLPGTFQSIHGQTNSPVRSSSDISSSVSDTTVLDNSNMFVIAHDTLENFPALEDDFLLDVASSENSRKNIGYDRLPSPLSPLHAAGYGNYCSNANLEDHDMDLWCDLFTRAEELVEFHVNM